jgi:hypothetical protein
MFSMTEARFRAMHQKRRKTACDLSFPTPECPAGDQRRCIPLPIRPCVWIYSAPTGTLFQQALHGHAMDGRTIFILALGMVVLLLLGFWMT